MGGKIQISSKQLYGEVIPCNGTTKALPLPNGYFCISLQVVYNSSAFSSTIFESVSLVIGKPERIERKFKTQNPNLYQ